LKRWDEVKVCVIGAGYVGLVAAACLAKLGNQVILVDNDDSKVEAINGRAFPVVEEGLEELLNQVHIEVTSDMQKAIDSEAIFICVGTPSDDDGSVSLKQMSEASQEISTVLKRKEEYCLVVVKSTVAPGTTEELIIPILEKSRKKIGKEFGVCMSPEFLREGKAVYDFMHPARLIIGEYDQRSGDTLLGLYHSFKAPVMRTGLKTAEMIKLASNAFLATKISFINEIGNICKNLGIDTYEVAEGIGYDDRIGNKFLNAGIGFGGSCLPKDLKGLISKSGQMGYEANLLQEVTNVNNKQALKAIELLRKHIPFKDSSVGVLGLAFKPGTDDVRDSVAIAIVQLLLEAGARIKAYDPLAVENFKKLFPQIEYATTAEVLNTDAILIVTEWDEFAKLDYRGKVVVDGRRIEKAKEARIYEGICW